MIARVTSRDVVAAPARLILEGTDGVGKTTIATRIRDQTGATYVHCGPPSTPTWDAEYLSPTLMRPERIVLDRWHIGEWVWPPFFGRESLFGRLGDLVECSDRLADAGFVAWVVTRSPLEIVGALVDRGEERMAVTSIIAQERFVEVAHRLQELSRLPIAVVTSDHLHEVTTWK